MDKIYVVRGTEQAGPFTEADIRAQLASGALTGDSMVWWDGLPEWTPLSRTPLGAPATKAPGAPGAVPPATSPMAASAVPPAAGRTSTLAIVSLVTAIMGLFCWPSAIVLGTAGVITGHLARKEIKRTPSTSGGGLALAGLIIGYLSLAIFAVVVFVYAAVIATAVHHQGMTFTPTLQDSSTNWTTNSAPPTPDSDSDTNASSTNSPAATPPVNQ